jgi:hypothetical protein
MDVCSSSFLYFFLAGRGAFFTCILLLILTKKNCLSCLHRMSVAKFWSGWVAYIADKWLLRSPFLSEGESECSLSWRTQSPPEVRWWFSLSFTCRWGQSSCTGILLSTQIGFCMCSICRGTRLLRCTFSGKRRISDKWSLDTCSCTDETLYLCGSLWYQACHTLENIQKRILTLNHLDPMLGCPSSSLWSSGGRCSLKAVS